jgi:hypothetical protein
MRRSYAAHRPAHFGAGIFLLALFCLPSPAAAQTCPSRYRPQDLSGPAAAQAQCTLRPVAIRARVGPRLASLPPALGSLLGGPVNVSRETLRRYLAARGIPEADIGGSLDRAVTADYLVIHDTSTPNLVRAEFPADINESTWPHNRLQRHAGFRRAHAFVNRVGDSLTTHDFRAATPRHGIKLEDRFPALAARFLHIENIQPRRCDTTVVRRCCPNPSSGICNDNVAPAPGFTDRQLDRLALLYVAASVRRGQWLIPAYHAVLDIGIPGAHDDPQNFDLGRWDSRLGALLDEIRATP